MTTHKNSRCARSQTHRFVWAAILLFTTSLSLRAALPPPLVQLHFDEGNGTTTTNNGSLGGTADFVVATGYPEFTNLLASGAYTPATNTWSVDFGNLGSLQGGQQVNLLTDPNLVADGSLGTNLSNGFTVCGWLNAHSLSEGWGGNRIAYCLNSGNNNGFDVVQLGNGALKVGINQWPDSTPAVSSPGKITVDPNGGAANWVFFATTFDPVLASGNTKIFFGGPTNLASLDSQFNYGAAITNAGPLTVGNASPLAFFWSGTGSGSQSRVFQGIIDEVQVFDHALSLAEIQQAQFNGTVPPVPATIATQPASVTAFDGQPANFSIQVNGSAPITYQWQTNGVNVAGATNASFSILATTNMSGTTVQVWVGNPVTPAFRSSNVTMTVLPETGLKIFTSLSESPANNAGDLVGYGVFSVRNGYPYVATNVPSGPFAPTNNVGCVEFGTFTDATQLCGRAVDFTNLIGNGATMGPMSGFTICGWVNCSDLTSGSGGNRLAYCLDSNLKGFDLVHDSGGSLWLGVNQWPDVPMTPAISSPGKITADTTEGSANWVFFAVTYDGTVTNDNCSFYFGSGTQAAALDWTVPSYPQGPIPRSGPITIGNANQIAGWRDFANTGGNGRCFRGLIDEIHVYNYALTLEQIQAAQKAPAGLPVATVPKLNATLQGSEIVISWETAGSFQLQSRSDLNPGIWANVTNAPAIDGTKQTVHLPVTEPTRFYRLQSQ